MRMEMSRIIFILTLACLALTAAQTPCSSLDPGPYLGTKPTLNMQVYEATQEDLERFPDSANYRDELRLAGTIGDSGPSGISLEVMDDFKLFDPKEVFDFHTEAVSGTNFIKLKAAVDRDGPSESLYDDIDLFTFTLKCVPASNTSIQVYYDVRILILDVNDNYPEFVGAPYSVSVNELASVGTTVTTVSAVDRDSSLSGNISYSIVPLDNDGSEHFRVDPDSGDIIVLQSLNYDLLPQGHKYYDLTVMACDGDRTSKKSTRTVIRINVTDGDDHGPVFEYEGCFRHKSACAWPKYTTFANQMKLGEPITVYPVPNTVGQPVTIKARDVDSSMSEVKFSIASTLPPGSESHFQVVSQHATGPYYTAAIRLVTPLTVNEGFEIFLKAEEQTENQRYDMAMIYFKGSNNGNPAGSDTTTDGNPDSEGQVGQPDKTPVTSGTSQETLALIVVVAILAAVVICLAIAFLCFVSGRRRNTKGHKLQGESIFSNSAYRQE